MDTSPEYISMCRKAKELQEMWEPSTSDYCVSSVSGCNRILVVIADLPNKFLVVAYPYATYDNTDHLLRQNIIWLPRIDQLISNWTNPYDAIESMLHGWPVEYDETESLEINGIKRVMKLKYNKSWNGEDWIE